MTRRTPEQLTRPAAASLHAAAAEESRREQLSAIRDVTIIVAFVAAGIVCAGMGDREHAGMLLAGALAYAAPASSRLRGSASRLLPFAVGIGAALALSGCAELTAAAKTVKPVLDVVCGYVKPAIDGAASSGGESAPAIDGDEEPRTIDGEDP